MDKVAILNFTFSSGMQLEDIKCAAIFVLLPSLPWLKPLLISTVHDHLQNLTELPFTRIQKCHSYFLNEKGSSI